jgi:hypothetical protein
MKLTDEIALHDAVKRVLARLEREMRETRTSEPGPEEKKAQRA